MITCVIDPTTGNATWFDNDKPPKIEPKKIAIEMNPCDSLEEVSINIDTIPEDLWIKIFNILLSPPGPFVVKFANSWMQIVISMTCKKWNSMILQHFNTKLYQILYRRNMPDRMFLTAQKTGSLELLEFMARLKTPLKSRLTLHMAIKNNRLPFIRTITTAPWNYTLTDRDTADMIKLGSNEMVAFVDEKYPNYPFDLKIQRYVMRGDIENLKRVSSSTLSALAGMACTNEHPVSGEEHVSKTLKLAIKHDHLDVFCYLMKFWNITTKEYWMETTMEYIIKFKRARFLFAFYGLYSDGIMIPLFRIAQLDDVECLITKILKPDNVSGLKLGANVIRTMTKHGKMKELLSFLDDGKIEATKDSVLPAIKTESKEVLGWLRMKKLLKIGSDDIRTALNLNKVNIAYWLYKNWDYPEKLKFSSKSIKDVINTGDLNRLKKLRKMGFRLSVDSVDELFNKEKFDMLTWVEKNQTKYTKFCPMFFEQSVKEAFSMEKLKWLVEHDCIECSGVCDEESQIPCGSLLMAILHGAQNKQFAPLVIVCWLLEKKAVKWAADILEFAIQYNQYDIIVNCLNCDSSHIEYVIKSLAKTPHKVAGFQVFLGLQNTQELLKGKFNSVEIGQFRDSVNSLVESATSNNRKIGRTKNTRRGTLPGGTTYFGAHYTPSVYDDVRPIEPARRINNIWDGEESEEELDDSYDQDDLQENYRRHGPIVMASVPRRARRKLILDEYEE